MPGRTNASKLRGKKFGRLRVEGETEERAVNGCIVWACRCRCGGRALVITTNLTSGNTLSCGCWRSDVAKVANRQRPARARALRGG